jgi:hypothetical protein
MAMKTIGVRFPGEAGQPAGKVPVYSYFVREGDRPELGDIIVADIIWASGRQEPVVQNDHDYEIPAALKIKANVATVVEVHAVACRKATKYYTQLLSRNMLTVIHTENEQLAARMIARQRAVKQLDAMLAQEDRRERYATLAKSNPAAAELLKELGDDPLPEIHSVGKPVMPRRTPITWNDD